MPVRRSASLLSALLIAVALSPALQAASSPVVATAQVKAQLLSAMASYVPGEPVLLALRLQPAPQWHISWRNPGDSGRATHIEWQLPTGSKISPIAWPLPRRFDSGGLISFGYADDTWLLMEVTPPASADGDFTIAARASWLACRDTCTPGKGAIAGEGTFSLTLPRGRHAAPSAEATTFAAAADRLPVEVDWPARFAIVDRTLQIEIAPPAGALQGKPQLFIAQQRLVDNGKPAQLQLLVNGIAISQPLSPHFREAPQQIDLILSLGNHGYAVRASRSDGDQRRTAWQ